MNAYRKLQAENRRLLEALTVAERGIQDLRAYALSDKYSKYPAEPGIAPADVVHRCVFLGFEISEALGFCEPEPEKREHRCVSCGAFWDCFGCDEHNRKSCSADRPDGYWSTCSDCKKAVHHAK
jgi:hypothetical protein